MEEEKRRIRVLCPSNLILCRNEAGIRWLVGSSAFFPPFTILSSFRSLHSQPNDDPFSPDFIKEADDIRSLLLRGFDIIGAIFVSNQNWEENALKAAEASCKMRKVLYGAHGDAVMIGAAADLVTGNIQFFVYGPGKSTKLEAVNTIIYEDNPQKFVWETGCLLRCELAMRLPIYVPTDRISEAGEIFSSAVDATAATFKDPSAVYIVEGSNKESEEVLQPVVLHHNELDFKTDLLEAEIIVDAAKGNDTNPISCSHFFQKDSPYSAFTAGKNADPIQVTILFNRSRNAAKSAAPVAEYFPVSEPSRLLVISFKLDVLTYVSKSFPVASAVSKLIFPGLVDQLTAMKKAIVPSLSSQHPQLCPYHFFPPGFLHPITTIYDLSYGEMEMRQVEIRRSLHLRLGLPLDRPLFLIANALNYADTKGATGNSLLRNGSQPLKDVHTEIPRSGVSGGIVSLVQGSYEYYHYLQYGYDDIGWGCAYRSLQTVISWFRLQHYTSIDVPSHREIQQALVEVGDKEPSFLGSREWIGAIELSFVLDKLLGVSCKIINVRSGSELPEKCRELALHFETQGTPVMIGGGVLAYTLLGVDYSETSGDCAFLILDPHYTGTDELKKIVNGGWCGWKKAIDSNGRNFFLHNKFYNLLLPQRPNMV